MCNIFIAPELSIVTSVSPEVLKSNKIAPLSILLTKTGHMAISEVIYVRTLD